MAKKGIPATRTLMKRAKKYVNDSIEAKAQARRKKAKDIWKERVRKANKKK